MPRSLAEGAQVLRDAVQIDVSEHALLEPPPTAEDAAHLGFGASGVAQHALVGLDNVVVVEPAID